MFSAHRSAARGGVAALIASATLVAAGSAPVRATASQPSVPVQATAGQPSAPTIESTLGSYLTGISCPAPRACAAVGYHNGPSGKTVTLAERWNGQRWTIAPTANPTGAQISYLTAVSCAAAYACMAVGYYQRVPGHTVSLAEWWNGVNWGLRATPQPPGSTATYLTGVSCTLGRPCMAVGYQYGRSGQAAALAESWTGRTWNLRPVSRPPGSPDSYLLAVSCSSAATCTAVGSLSTRSFAQRTWATEWNGITWVAQHPVSPPKTNVAALLGVSCSSATRCVAVGYGENSSGRSRPLAESRHGSQWTIEVTSVPAGSNISDLTAIDCPAGDAGDAGSAGNACTAVGFFHTPAGDDETLAEHRGATKWRIEPTPNPAASTDSYLNSVSCTMVDTGNACWSVGSSGVLLNRERTLAEVRAHDKWTIQPTGTP